MLLGRSERRPISRIKTMQETMTTFHNQAHIFATDDNGNDVYATIEKTGDKFKVSYSKLDEAMRYEQVFPTWIKAMRYLTERRKLSSLKSRHSTKMKKLKKSVCTG